MRYELRGSVAELIDECAGESLHRVFNLGFGFQLKVYRLHGEDLQQFRHRLQKAAQTTSVPKIVNDMMEDLAVCDGVLIIEHSKATLVYGSPYELDMSSPCGHLEHLSHQAEYLQTSLSKFEHPLYSAAGQAR